MIPQALRDSKHAGVADADARSYAHRMCGRYAIGATPGEFHEVGLAPDFGDFEPRYNVAPTQWAPVIRLEGSEVGLRNLRWGVIPPWAESTEHRPQPINARWESVAQSKLWRPMLDQRCLALASGYYEWTRPGKQPHYIHRADGRPLLMAGLWCRWSDVECYAVLTTSPSKEIAGIHDRMPLLVTEPSAWLESGRPGERPALTAHPVSRRVGSVRNDDPDLMRPDMPAQQALF